MIRRFTSKTQAVGEQGEELAVAHLSKLGYAIVERNVPNKLGEIDIVAKKGSTYYFFEVKAGRMGGWLNPAENLTKEKLRKFLLSVEYYCLVHNISAYEAKGIVVLLPVAHGANAQVTVLDLT